MGSKIKISFDILIDMTSIIPVQSLLFCNVVLSV